MFSDCGRSIYDWSSRVFLRQANCDTSVVLDFCRSSRNYNLHFQFSTRLLVHAFCVRIWNHRFSQSEKLITTWICFRLFACLLVLLIAGFLQFFFNNTVYELCISIFGAILFSLFIIYDTHMLMQKLSAEEYIHATISLYLDIINLFIYILRILQATKNWFVRYLFFVLKYTR